MKSIIYLEIIKSSRMISGKEHQRNHNLCVLMVLAGDVQGHEGLAHVVCDDSSYPNQVYYSLGKMGESSTDMNISIALSALKTNRGIQLVFLQQHSASCYWGSSVNANTENPPKPISISVKN